MSRPIPGRARLAAAACSLVALNLVLLAADFKNPMNSPALAKLKQNKDEKV